MTRPASRPTLPILALCAAAALAPRAAALEPPVPDLAAAAAAGPASTAAYGARCIGPAHDDTPAFQAAIDTGHTVYAPAMGGHCHITHALVMRTPGQIFGGDGRARTRIEVQPGFTGEGVFVAKTGEPGPVWRDLSVSFSQPFLLYQYPPAFHVLNTPRFLMTHVGCYLATTCVDMTGNSGGATITDLQMSAFKIGIDINGSADSIRLQSIHAWPFSVAGAEQRAQLAKVIWIRSGKVDDLKISDGLFLGGIALSIFTAAEGSTTGSVTNTDFDGDHRAIEMDGGNLSVFGGYLASAGPSDQQVHLRRGTLGIYNATIGCSSGGQETDLPAIDVDGADALLTVMGSPSLLCGQDDRPILRVRTGTADFSQNNVVITPNLPYLHPKIEVLGKNSRLTAIGNRVSDKGEAHGEFFVIESDNVNRIIGNAAPGWRNVVGGRSMPISAIGQGLGVYMAN